MAQQSDPAGSLVVSYLGLRKAIGIIGLALPFVLSVGKILFQSRGIEISISNYYYTVMGDVFVGSMCAIGVFLMSYRGYERKDEIAGKIACILAVGVALFPTTPGVNATSRDVIIGNVHLACAALLFLTLAYFCLALFRKTDPSKPPTRQKLQRNIVYTLCGYTIVISMALAAATGFLPAGAPLLRLNPVFWLESLAIVAFGVSWLTKGEAILKDDEG